MSTDASLAGAPRACWRALGLREAHVVWLGPEALVDRRVRRRGDSGGAEPVVISAADGDRAVAGADAIDIDRAAEGHELAVDAVVDTAVEVAGEADASAAETLFEAWCSRHPATVCDLLLSAHLVHSRLLDDAPADCPEPVLAGRARRAWASFHGADALAWPVAIGEGMRGGRSGRGAGLSFVACAPDGLDLGRLQAGARRHGVRLRSVQPAWCAAWARSLGDRRADGRLAVFEPGAVTWLGVQGGRCTAIVRQRVDTGVASDDAALAALLRAAPLPGDAEPSAAAAAGGPATLGATATPAVWHLDGHALTARAPVGAAVHADAARPWPRLDATRPGRGVAVPEFVAERGPRLLAWGVLALGAVALVSAGLVRAEAASRRDAALARLEAMSRAEAVASTSPSLRSADRQKAQSPERSRANDAVVDLAAAATVRAVAARLRYPWAALVDGVESAVNPGVHLIDFGHDATAADTAGRSALRVAGVAVDARALDDFVTTLAASPLLVEVVVRRQSPLVRGTAGGVEFEIAATLPPRAGLP